MRKSGLDNQERNESDSEDDAAPPAIRIVQNWYEEFRDRE
jgi:hypothetical protein